MDGSLSLEPPDALAQWPAIAGRLAGRLPALFLDYDGTLSPIVERPDLALLPDAARTVVARLAEHMPVAILSGRQREDVAALVGLPGITYAGSHGFDIAGPSLRHLPAPGAEARIRRVAARLRHELGDIAGMLVEDKRFAVAVHYRRVDERELPRITAAVDRAAAPEPGEEGRLRQTGGKKVWELRPDVDWDKGRALVWLLDHLRGEPRQSDFPLPDLVPVAIGDDVTDESAFAAAAHGGGFGILVAEEPRPTAAAYRLHDPAATLELLTRLTARFAADPRDPL